MAVNTEILRFLDTLKDALAGLARDVMAARADGKIDAGEAIALAMKATTAFVPVLAAFRGLSQTGVSDLLDALYNSDLVFDDERR